jgi:hypothetical protein
MKSVKYLYYRLYKYYSERPVPLIRVFFALFGLMVSNIMSLFNILQIVRGIKTRLPSSGLGELMLWALLLSFPLYAVYSHYLKSGYHDQIIDEFKQETKRQKLISRLFVFLYFVLSIGGWLFTSWLRQELSK